MSMLAVVDMLNSVPPGAPVPEGAVVFAMPAPLVWAIGLALLVAVLAMARRMGGRVAAWWRLRVRRLRRTGSPVVVESVGIPSL